MHDGPQAALSREGRASIAIQIAPQVRRPAPTVASRTPARVTALPVVSAGSAASGVGGASARAGRAAIGVRAIARVVRAPAWMTTVLVNCLKPFPVAVTRDFP